MSNKLSTIGPVGRRILSPGGKLEPVTNRIVTKATGDGQTPNKPPSSTPANNFADPLPFLDVSGPTDVETQPNPLDSRRAEYVASQNDQYLLDPSGEALNKPKSRGAASRSLGSTF